MSADLYKNYLKEIHRIWASGEATEPSYYPVLKEFIETCAGRLKKPARITVQPRRTRAGIPDFLLRSKDQSPIGYIEAKDPSTELSDVANSDQLRRYRDSLPNLLLTNFLEFWLFRNGKPIGKVRLANPFTLIQLGAPPAPEHTEEFVQLLDQFLSFSIPITRSAQHLACELARRTRFLEYLTFEELRHLDEGLQGFLNAFRRDLLPSLTPARFADLYAQTITYGLFAARMRAGNEAFNRKLAYEYIPSTIPLLRDLFYSLTGPRLPESLEWIVDEIAGVLGATDLTRIREDFHTRVWTQDPVIHFYETFLKEYNPGERKRLGVYYTPEPVVSYIVRSIHEILKERFGKSDGLADRTVTLLDPAAGTLTFPAMAVRLAKEEFEHQGKLGLFPGLVKEHILPHFYAFELMVAPYAVGHLKISVVLDDLGYKLGEDERVQFYLTNALELDSPRPEKGEYQMPLIADLAREGARAKEVKEDVPVLVVLGNPPYTVHSENKSRFIEGLMEDYKISVRGERNIQPLSDDYIKFIRFAQWRIERTGQGIVGLITNNSYLSGLIHRGMRQSLLDAFDEIYILNLHGSARIGERIPQGRDENVFDIRQGVAIALFVKHPAISKKRVANGIYYADLYGLREKKYEWLLKHDITSTRWQPLKPKEPYYFFEPKEFRGEARYQKFWSVKEIFREFSSGVKTHRDHFVVGFTKDEILERLRIFTGPLPDEMITQSLKLKDTWGWKLSLAREKAGKEKFKELIRPYAYRVFDNRFICYSLSLIERDRLSLMKHLLFKNIALVTTRLLSSFTFQHVFITELIGDMCFISNRGKEANYYFPLYLYRTSATHQGIFEGAQEPKLCELNFKPKFLTAVQQAFGRKAITPEEIFYYIYAVLYSNIYRKKYAEFLKIDFPRIPFTADYRLFKRLSGLGQELVELHLLKSPLLLQSKAKYPIAGTDKVEKWKYNEKEERLFINDNQYFEGIPKEAWEYHIGGYQVLDHWLKDRKLRRLSFDEIEHFLKVITTLKHTLKLQQKIDNLYPEVEKQTMPYEG